ncbi:winged helix-turn-helix domain-containing protein [Candidatus Bathyarchaeota archaeon]|nr:winged helix-turn-helix domain-containing protein [Candidatus Bathyarchaeota archaeon]
MNENKELLEVSNIFRALGSHNRLKIIELVNKTERPLHIKAVAQVLKKDYAAIYRHIKVLEKNGLVGVYEVGRSRVIYLKNSEQINECVRIAKNMILTC